MQKSVEATLDEISFGEAQCFNGLRVIPLIDDRHEGTEYLTLGEALARELVTMKEIGKAGSVPEIWVRNDADLPVLIVDGEELRGAKQNRAVNTTILIKEHANTLIPVSCTEQGRWSSVSDMFTDSHSVMATKIRCGKSRTVSQSLSDAQSFRSDQGRVWTDVQELHDGLGTHSRTGAMSDAYDGVQEKLIDANRHLSVGKNQCGILVFLNDEILGLDLVSQPAAYVRIHERLIKSYVIDALRNKPGATESTSIDDFRSVFSPLKRLKESGFPSIGYGMDYRYVDESICGSALVHEGACIHTAFFWDRH